MGCYAIQDELTSRCQRYGISLNDCLNSVYLPKREYDEYLQSFNLPIVRDSSCNKGRCMAVVYKDVNKCMNCRKEDCRDECKELEWMREGPSNGPMDSYRRNSEPPIPFIHVIHHKDTNKSNSAPATKTEEVPLVSYKSITVIETKTETVSEHPATISRDEQKKDTHVTEDGKTCETKKEDTKTIFKTVEIPVISEKVSQLTRSERPEKQRKYDDNIRKTPVKEGEGSTLISSSVKRSKLKDSSLDDDKIDEVSEAEKGFEDDEKEKGEPTVVTVTRVFYKTVSVEKPITLYREVTTTVKSEVPIINYKLTTVKEISTSTKTESSVKTETVVQTQYSTIISTKAPHGQEIPKVPEESISMRAPIISGETSKRNEETQKSTKTIDSSSSDPSTSEFPSVVYRTITKPTVSVLTVTKTEEVTTQTASRSDPSQNPGSQKGEGVSASISLPASISLICTEKCLTVSVPETSEKKEVFSSVAASLSDTQGFMNTGRQDIIAELLPLVRKVLIEDLEETKCTKTPKQSSHLEMASDLVKTVTKTVVKTVERETKNKGGHKTVYNTVYSYKKKPNCRKGVEGKKRKVCKESEEQFVTTVYV